MNHPLPAIAVALVAFTAGCGPAGEDVIVDDSCPGLVTDMIDARIPDIENAQTLAEGFPTPEDAICVYDPQQGLAVVTVAHTVSEDDFRTGITLKKESSPNRLFVATYITDLSSETVEYVEYEEISYQDHTIPPYYASQAQSCMDYLDSAVFASSVNCNLGL
jgi:hypothetical protein